MIEVIGQLAGLALIHPDDILSVEQETKAGSLMSFPDGEQRGPFDR